MVLQSSPLSCIYIACIIQGNLRLFLSFIFCSRECLSSLGDAGSPPHSNVGGTHTPKGLAEGKCTALGVGPTNVTVTTVGLGFVSSQSSSKLCVANIIRPRVCLPGDGVSGEPIWKPYIHFP